MITNQGLEFETHKPINFFLNNVNKLLISTNVMKES